MQARTSRDGQQIVVEAILQVHSVDLVADPATTRGLFESQQESAEIKTLTEELTQLRAEVDALRGAKAASERPRRPSRGCSPNMPCRSPDAADDVARAIVSPGVLLESLLSAPSEAAVRERVADRAALVHEERVAGRRRRPPRTSRWPASSIESIDWRARSPNAASFAPRDSRRLTRIELTRNRLTTQRTKTC